MAGPERIGPETPASSGILIEPLHGQFQRRGFKHAAFPGRNARFHLSAIGIWEQAADDEACISRTRATYDRLQAFSVGGTYVNYIAPDEPPDRARSAYPPEVYARLRAVKRRFDPDNVFRSNINIAP